MRLTLSKGTREKAGVTPTKGASAAVCWPGPLCAGYSVILPAPHIGHALSHGALPLLFPLLGMPFLPWQPLLLGRAYSSGSSQLPEAFLSPARWRLPS